MLIGPDWVIGHLGKTGGDAIRSRVSVLGLDRVHVDPADDPIKHRPFHVHPYLQGRTRGKMVALGIRRLPNHVLSHYHHRTLNRLRKTVEGADELLKTLPREDVLPEFGDILTERVSQANLSQFISHTIVDYWIRCEKLESDLLYFLGQFYRLTPAQLRRFWAVETREAMDYDKNPYHWFTREQLDELYQYNPRWAHVERQMYGDWL